MRGTVTDVIWRFGAAAEPILVETTSDPETKAAGPAAWILERIGSRLSLDPLRRLRDARPNHAMRYYAGRAVEAIEARSRTLG